MARVAFGNEPQSDQRPAVCDPGAGNHPDTRHFVSVSVVAPETASGAAVIRTPLEHPEHPIVRIKGSLVYFDTGSARPLIPDPNAALLGVLGIVAQQMTGIPRLVFERARATLP
jgi:hypothetical protein